VLIGYLPVLPASEVARLACRKALAEAGCEQIVEEQAGGMSDCTHDEPHALLDRLQKGDTLVVPQLRSLGNSLSEVVRHVQSLTTRAIGLRSLDDALDAVSWHVQSLMPRVAADPALTDSRVNPGGTDVRRRGAGGRPPKLSQAARAEVIAAVLSGRSKAAALARRYKVSAATISRVLAARRADGSEAAYIGASGAGASPADRIVGVLSPAALDTRLAVVGTSGSGKTYAAKGLLERVMASGGRVCVVDPLGVWWGLAKGVDGADPPFPVAIFGGAHADVPLDPDNGAALGRLIGRETMACVVDVSDFGSAAARRAFMTAFTTALYEANTEPLHLVLDEADLWAPQRTQPDGMELLGRMEEIVRRGRVRGFVPWLITQRPAVLHKDVLSQADILVSMKLTSSQDRAAVGRWIEGQADRAEGRRILGALPQLRRGEGWVWAPGEGVLAPVSFPRIRTLDSSQTPARRDQPGTQRALAAVDPSAIAQALAKVVVDGGE
jgi:hypothetical protein